MKYEILFFDGSYRIKIITPRNPSTGFLFFVLFLKKIQHIVYVTEKTTKKEELKIGYIKVQTVCLVIIAIAAVKYLLPDIRKLCRMIGGEEKKKVEKESVKEPAAEPKKQEKKDNPKPFPDWEEKEEE